MTTKKLLTLDEAAKHLGISSDDLMTSFHRGLPPGLLAFKNEGVLVWNKDDLIAPKKSSAKPKAEPEITEEAESEDVPA